jgi:Protein of unknown function DUF72
MNKRGNGNTRLRPGSARTPAVDRLRLTDVWSEAAAALVAWELSSRHLTYYAAKFDSVEVDSTFYRGPSTSTVAGWARNTREGFALAAKHNERQGLGYRGLRGA